MDKKEPAEDEAPERTSVIWRPGHEGSDQKIMNRAERARMPQDAFSVWVIHDPTRESAQLVLLPRGAAWNANIDEFALLLQPIKNTWRNYRGSTRKLIQL
jgi:hypothetical protein